MVNNYGNMWSHFRLIPEPHGETDRWTDRIAISISRASTLTLAHQHIDARASAIWRSCISTLTLARQHTDARASAHWRSCISTLTLVHQHIDTRTSAHWHSRVSTLTLARQTLVHQHTDAHASAHWHSRVSTLTHDKNEYVYVCGCVTLETGRQWMQCSRSHYCRPRFASSWLTWY